MKYNIIIQWYNTTDVMSLMLWWLPPLVHSPYLLNSTGKALLSHYLLSLNRLITTSNIPPKYCLLHHLSLLFPWIFFLPTRFSLYSFLLSYFTWLGFSRYPISSFLPILNSIVLHRKNIYQEICWFITKTVSKVDHVPWRKDGHIILK